MRGLSAVAMETERSTLAVARAALALVSRRQWSTKTRLAEASRRMDSRRLCAIMGSMTLRSSWPHWPPVRTATLLPVTWAATMVTDSQTTGLTLPGMMLEPGWMAG